MFRKVLWALIPVLLFLGLIYVLAQGLKRDQQQMPSALLDKPLPEFNLPDLYDEQVTYNKQSFPSAPLLINVWASWCPPCAQEHEIVVELAQEGVPIIGLNYQDARESAQLWLKERGDPYQKILYDEQGSVGIDWGVIAVPETFLIDADGIVRYRHIGALTREIWNNKFLPMYIKLMPQQSISPYQFNNPADEARFYHLTAQLRCLVCQNQTLLDSDAPLAKNLREEVYTQVLEGHSDEKILKYLTTRYGDFILYQPPVNKSTWLLWFGPIFLLLVVAAILIIIIRRAHKQHQGEK
jgi:cytochrome c biogenesis protein CcmG/thiol:disulfide interchange protein DsbE